MNEEDWFMKTAFYGLGAGIIVGLLAILASLALGWTTLATQRPMAKYAKETERQVYMNSVAHQQGANSGIGQDCANMEAGSGPSRLAFARFVLSDAAAYSGDRGLSDASVRCVGEAKSALASAQ